MSDDRMIRIMTMMMMMMRWSDALHALALSHTTAQSSTRQRPHDLLPVVSNSRAKTVVKERVTIQGLGFRTIC